MGCKITYHTKIHFKLKFRLSRINLSVANSFWNFPEIIMAVMASCSMQNLKERACLEQISGTRRVNVIGNIYIYIYGMQLLIPTLTSIHICLNHSKPTWWSHQMETLSALLDIGVGNSPITGEFPAQRPLTRSFDVFFDLPLNRWLSKQSWVWWFETLSRPLWRHCNDLFYFCKLKWTSQHDIAEHADWLAVVLPANQRPSLKKKNGLTGG